MTDKLTLFLNKFRKDVRSLDNHRVIWLILSAVIFFGVILFGLSWNYLVKLNSTPVWTTVLSGALTITVFWWYWTMRMIRRLLEHQDMVIEILVDITTDVKKIKNHISEIVPK